MTTNMVARLCIILASLAIAAPAQAQATAERPVAPLRGTLERIRVHGPALAGNLEGDAPDRFVSVYLPPSYGDGSARRYPVLFLLHGYTDSDENWFGFRPHFVNVPAALERALARGTAREMILVMPNAHTIYQGSMYSSSVTTGDWERYIAEDLVAYVDRHYRTIAHRASRGLAGHSMGGYGTIRIGMKRPDVFSSIYVMSAGALRPNLATAPGIERAEAIRSVADFTRADFGTRATIAIAAAWSPNPQKPPLFVDLPTSDGKTQPDVVARWAANAPLAMVPQYLTQLRQLHAIALDAGAQDGAVPADTRALAELLALFGIAHTCDIYEPGTHTSRVDERIEQYVLPFFSRHLSFTP